MDLVRVRSTRTRTFCPDITVPDHCKQHGPSRTLLDTMDAVYDALGFK